MWLQNLKKSTKKFELNNQSLSKNYYFMKTIIRIFTRLYPFDRGVWRISKAAGSFVKGEDVVKTKRGVRLLLRLENYIDRIIYLFGKYEEPLVEKLESGIRAHNCEIFIDVGGNLGYYSLAIQKTGVIKEIHCFEPDPLNLHMLKTNILLNKAEGNITVHPFAATSERKELRFGLQRSAGHLNTGLSRILQEGEGVDGEEIVVQGVPVDERCDFKDKKLAIKIDVEGAEKEALEGMVKLLKSNSCYVQIEVWPKNAEAIEQTLSGIGYRKIEKIGEQDYYWTNFS